MTVLSHLATKECWGTEGKAKGGKEDRAHEKAVDKVQSNQVSHQSGSGEEDEKDKKEHEGELENKVMEVNVEVEVIITLCRIHAELNTWVIHHP